MKNNVFALYFTFIAYETYTKETNIYGYTIFSAFEPKAQVSFSNKNLSVVCRNRHCRFRCRELFGFCLLLQNHMSISTKFAQSTLGLREFK